jgi:NADH:ubiquinone reductase (H+-translocating)
VSKKAETSVVIVGGGFAGVSCAKQLSKHGVRVTLIDRHDYNQFQPLLYQVATAQVHTSDVARPLRAMFPKRHRVHVTMAEVSDIDPVANTVTSADGVVFGADYLVVAVGAEPNFFHTPGAAEHAFPLYSVDDAERLRSRFLTVIEGAYRNARLVDQGALNFVIVGAGATGVETAGAVAEAINRLIPARVGEKQMRDAAVYVIDPAPVVLAPFSDHAHAYAKKVLEERGVHLELGTKVDEVRADRVRLSDGREILTRAVVWAGGIKIGSLASHDKLPHAPSGRLEVGPDLAVIGFPSIFALGDVANTLQPDGKPFPQLGSVALQAGHCAANNILADIEGKAREPFHYRDKGIMAMIGRNAAIAEVGPRRRELHGVLAYVSWLGIHAWLLSGFRTRVQALGAWSWNYFGHTRAAAYINRPDATHIDWDDEPPSP